MPTSRRAWLPVSARECTASASVADECERYAAANLHAAIATLPASAARTTFRLSAWAMLLFTHSHRGSRELRVRRRRVADDRAALRLRAARAQRSSSLMEPALRRRTHGWSAWPGVLASRGLDVVHVQLSLHRGPAPRARQERRARGHVACGRAAPCARRARLPAASCFIGGKSMGGRIATQVAAGPAVSQSAAGPMGELAGLVLLGYPLHPPGRPDKLRTAHLPRVMAPMLFVQGSRDTFGTPAELEPLLAPLAARGTRLLGDRRRRPLARAAQEQRRRSRAGDGARRRRGRALQRVTTTTTRVRAPW